MGKSRWPRIARLVAQGSNLANIDSCRSALEKAGAVPLLIDPRLGTYPASDKGVFEADASMENSPAVLFDALIVVDGDEAISTLEKIGNTMEFIRDQYRHRKTIMVLGSARRLIDKVGISFSARSAWPIFLQEQAKGWQERWSQLPSTGRFLARKSSRSTCGVNLRRPRLPERSRRIRPRLPSIERVRVKALCVILHTRAWRCRAVRRACQAWIASLLLSK